ncbi:MAG: endonuclease MutS2 [Sulfurospirillum sp.]|nr:endonuclease MutS2 [Sulfurospirillum sp.]
MEQLLVKLDLQEYANEFQSHFSRQKPFFLEGDIHLHFKMIQELDLYLQLNAPPTLEPMQTALAHLQKSGVLVLQEIHSFVKILRYFQYLRKNILEGLLASWLEKIEISKEMSDICNYFNDKGELRDETDERFANIQNALAHIKEDIAQILRRLLSNAKLGSYLVDRQVHYINNQEALLLRGGFNHVLKGNIIARSSGGFFYVNPEGISKLKSKQSELLDKKEELIYQYCKQISAILAKNYKFLRFLDREFDRFDHYFARVSFARSRDLHFIIPTKNQTIKLAKFSHPALKDAKAISLNFQGQVLMVTGVNAGGKTMLLKSILSSVFLAKYLLPMSIDVQNSQIGSFKQIVAILDDPQSVKNDISTFAGRMSQFAQLFNTREALIGVDEIELGTDADEAASLFKVLLEELMARGAKVVITTHHKRLASLMATHEKVELLAAIYDEKAQRPTYGFLQGTIGRSYAFETALRYGISANFIAKAKELYGEDKEKLNDLIQKNIDLELVMKKEAANLEQSQEEFKRAKNALQEERETAKKEFEAQKSQLHFEYTKAIVAAKEAIKTKDSSQAHRELNKAHEYKKAVHVSTHTPQQKEPLAVGDLVKYASSKGVIKSIKKESALIECDGIKMQVPLHALKRRGEQKLLLKSTKVRIQTSVDTASTVVLDLHGLRSEEAIEKLDKFLSDSLINGFDEVMVYHGIGTGKLAYAVKTFLKTHPSVLAFSDAPPNQGGFGATLVKL